MSNQEATKRQNAYTTLLLRLQEEEHLPAWEIAPMLHLIASEHHIAVDEVAAVCRAFLFMLRQKGFR